MSHLSPQPNDLLGDISQLPHSSISQVLQRLQFLPLLRNRRHVHMDLMLRLLKLLLMHPQLLLNSLEPLPSLADVVLTLLPVSLKLVPLLEELLGHLLKLAHPLLQLSVLGLHMFGPLIELVHTGYLGIKGG